VRGPVLVTGAAGFIGRHLVPHLARAGWAVRAAARDPSRVPAAEGISPTVLGDISQPLDWRPLVEGTTHIVHLAGLAHATRRIPEERYAAINARTLGPLGEAARNAGVRRLLLFSSVRAQSGPAAKRILTEEMVPLPTDAYGRSKLAAECRLAEVLAAGRTDWTVLRPVLVYGQGVAGNMRSLLSLARSPLPLPLGALAGRRSLVSIDNLASAALHVLSADAASRRMFLVADPEPMTAADIVACIRAALGRRPLIFPFPAGPMGLALRALGQEAIWQRLVRDLVADTAALKGTGWHPLETSAQGLSRWAQMEASSARHGA